MTLPKITHAQLLRWRKIEMEHTTSPKRAEGIMWDHIREHGVKYYPKLIKMERTLPRFK